MLKAILRLGEKDTVKEKENVVTAALRAMKLTEAVKRVEAGIEI